MEIYSKAVKGCNNKCPCPGRWINCYYYVDKIAQEWRVKHKQLDSEIEEYYKDQFNDRWFMHDLYAGG